MHLNPKTIFLDKVAKSDTHKNSGPPNLFANSGATSAEQWNSPESL